MLRTIFSAFVKRLMAIAALPLTILFFTIFSPENRDVFVGVFATAVLLAMISRLGSDAFLYTTITKGSEAFRRPSAYSNATVFISLAMFAIAIAGWLLFDRSPTQGLVFHFAVGATTLALILLQDRATILQIFGYTFWSSVVYPPIILMLVSIGEIAGFTVYQSFLMGAGLVIVSLISRLIFKKRQELRTSLKLVRPKLICQLLPHSALGINKACFDWGVSLYVVSILDSAALTTFIIASRIAATLSIPANSLNAFLLREFSLNFNTHDKQRDCKLAVATIQLCILFQFGLIIIYWMAFPSIVTLFKLEPAAFASVLIPLCVSQVVHGVSGPNGSMLQMSGYQTEVALVSFCVAIGTILIGIAGASLFGLLGLGIAIGGMLIIQNILYMALMFSKRGYLPVASVFERF